MPIQQSLALHKTHGPHVTARVQSQPGKAQQRWERFFCGLAAGMIAKLGTHPLDVAKKRFQVGVKQGHHSLPLKSGLPFVLLA